VKSLLGARTASPDHADDRSSTLRAPLESLTAYDWPGNVRELQNVIERSIILSDGATFAVDEAWLRRNAGAPDAEDGERQKIEAALAASKGPISGPRGAATLLGIPRQTLESRIRALRINKHQFKPV
jgi:formate hydrogenlyase transcriptional activator